MIEVNATKLRNNLFEYLVLVSKGESIAIKRNGKEIAMIVPPKSENWRDRIQNKMKLLVSANEIMTPMDDVWEKYI